MWAGIATEALGGMHSLAKFRGHSLKGVRAHGSMEQVDVK